MKPEVQEPEDQEPEVFETSDADPIFGFQETEVQLSTDRLTGRRLGDAGATKSVPTLVVSNIPQGLMTRALEAVFEGDPGFQHMRRVSKLASDELIVDYSDVRFAAEAMKAHQGHIFSETESHTGLVLEWDTDKLDDAVAIEPRLAFEVFAGKVYQSKSSLPPHRVLSSGHGDLGDNQSESSLPTERYFRLRDELDALERDVGLLSQSKEETTTKRPNEVWVAMTAEVQRMQQQLGSLAVDSPLKGLLTSSQDTEGSSTVTSSGEKNRTSELSVMIDDLNTKMRVNDTTEPNQSEKPVAVYELYCNGRSVLNKSDVGMVHEAERVGALERRMACLEKVFGHTQATDEFDTAWEKILTDDIKETRVTSLVEKVAALEQRVALLDPSKVEGCAGALKSLRKELGLVANEKRGELRGDVVGDDAVMKVVDLHRRTKVMDDFGLGAQGGGELSALVLRLETLQSLHEQAVLWVNRLTLTEQHQALTEERCRQDEEVLRHLEHSLASNMQTLKSNIAAIDERIDRLSVP